MQLVLPTSWPPGFSYHPEILTADQERELLDAIARVRFAEVRMHGTPARRRTAHFGWSYAYDSARVTSGQPLPPFLVALRSRIAPLADTPPEAFEEALVTNYPPGAGIGWHRDAPAFGDIVAGVSLGAPCELRMRPGRAGRATFVLELAPRSAYVLSGRARRDWQHHIPPVQAQRYSITFRTVRETAKAP